MKRRSENFMNNIKINSRTSVALGIQSYSEWESNMLQSFISSLCKEKGLIKCKSLRSAHWLLSFIYILCNFASVLLLAINSMLLRIPWLPIKIFLFLLNNSTIFLCVSFHRLYTFFFEQLLVVLWKLQRERSR